MKAILLFSVLLVSTAFGQRGGNSGYGNNRQPGRLSGFAGSNSYGVSNSIGGFGGFGAADNSNYFGRQSGFGGSDNNGFGGQGGFGRFGNGFDNGRFGGPGGFGGHNNGHFGGPGGFGRPGDFRNNFQGEFGFGMMGFGKHHHHGFGPHFLPFLRNLTQEQRQSFFEIVSNRNLTKAEVRTQLQQWANNVGGNMTEQLNEFDQKRQETKQRADEKFNEIIANVTSLAQQVKQIKDNMQITMSEEFEQIKKLFDEQSMSVMKAFKAVEMAAFKEAMRSVEGQQPEETLPTVQQFQL
uniref:DUF148 domain-containing protein n=1 Tax=Syphacia muris TaxID=451379 RepID=A0A0N5AHF1_9BILA